MLISTGMLLWGPFTEDKDWLLCLKHYQSWGRSWAVLGCVEKVVSFGIPGSSGLSVSGSVVERETPLS